MDLQHHIHLGPEHLEGNDGLGRYVLIPGDPARAQLIAAHLIDVETVENPRGHHAHLGRLAMGGDEPAADVLVIPGGMGSGSTEIIVQEVLNCGAKRLLRVGSCGTMTDDIRPGQVVIATAAVRDEQTSQHYAPPEFPAFAHPAAVEALVTGAHDASLADETFLGVCHSKASFYAREFGHGPAGRANLEYDAWLRRCGVVASEMEASAVFVLASVTAARRRPLSEPCEECQAGAVLAVFATDDPEREFRLEDAQEAERKTICVAVEAVRAWAKIDRRARAGLGARSTAAP